MAVVTTNLGPVTAYGDAVRGGYTGTKEQWEALMADYGTIGTQAQADAQTASTAAQTATTKASEASASATQAQQAAASVSTPDTTLTQSGKAADAKATGDAVAELKEDLQDMTTATSADVGKALKAKTVTNGKVTEWEFGEAGTTVELDATLTDPTKAAQAKAVGDRLRTLNKEEVTWSTPANGKIGDNGAWRDDSAWISSHTNKLYCEEGWEFESCGGTYSTGLAPSALFYSGDTVVGSSGHNIGTTATVTIPNGVDGVVFQVANVASNGLPAQYYAKQISPLTVADVMGASGKTGQIWVKKQTGANWADVDSFVANKANQSNPPLPLSADTVGYIRSDGSLSYNTAWHCVYTDKIECEPGWKFRYQGGTYNGVANSILFFLNGTAVSQIRYAIGSDVIVTVPDGVNQVMFQTATITANAVSLNVEKTYPMSLEQVVDYCESQDEIIDRKADYSDNIVISDDTPGKMNAERTLTDTSAWHCLYTNVLDVKPGWKFKYIGGSYSTNLSACVFFRNNGTPVSSESYDIGVEVEITIPDGVNQVWFQMSTVSSAPLSLVVKRIYPVSLENVLSDFDNVSNRFYGLKDGTLLPKYKVLDGEEYGYIGRWYDYVYDGNNVKVASAAGAEVCFKVSGTTSITINWTGANVGEHVYYCYYIDDAEKVRRNITVNTITLPDTDEHIVRIVCDSIPHSGSTNCWTVGYGWVFGGVDANGGTLKGIVPTNKTVMYFGDSLTEGVRAYGAETGEQVEADVDSATESYGFYTSKYLGCASVIVGYGSTGIMSNGYFRKCIDALNYLANGKETPDISPDLIVINHGHNDTGYNSETWIAGFDAVIERYMTKYPGVEVVALSPFNLTHASDMETACENKPHCHYVDTASWGLRRYYADGPGHLTAAGAEVCGRKLAQAILELNLL